MPSLNSSVEKAAGGLIGSYLISNTEANAGKNKTRFDGGRPPADWG